MESDVPRPSCPAKLAPQHSTEPSFFTAQACSPLPFVATAICATSVRPGTAVGVGCSFSSAVPRPSSPALFLPQQATVASARSAQLDWPPSASAVTPVSPATARGLCWSSVTLDPRAPYSWLPQQ